MKKIIVEVANGTKMVQTSTNKGTAHFINKWFNDDNVVFISTQKYPLHKNDVIILKDTKIGKDELND